ncbi:MAG: ATP-dependent helicase, partial [Nocardioides sp.]
MGVVTAPRLVRPTPRDAASGATAPLLDAEQKAVIGHPGGPLLVLAGPGTGKTTTLVEAIAERVAGRDLRPESVLALTFSRKAAHRLRERIAARLGGTAHALTCATFHSFAYGLLRQHSPTEQYGAPLRLISAAEQDVIIRELLTRDAAAWPPELAAAVRTRGFAREVAAVVARTQEQGLGFERLRLIGESAGRPAWVAAAGFLEQYDAVLTDQNLLDYPGLLAQTVSLLQDPGLAVREHLRARFEQVFVDEYQDTDPAQVALLKAVAGDGRNLIAFGDPHQSIYAFRGAESRGLSEFAERFPTTSGDPAPVIALRTTRRFGHRINAATRRVATRLPAPAGLPAVIRTAFSEPECAPGVPDGVVETITFDTERAEAEHLADLLRRAHLEDGFGWSEMAVLVRSGKNHAPALRRALLAADVPVEVASDELPIAREPAVMALLDGLRAVAEYRVRTGLWEDDLQVRALLASPLGGVDPVETRAVARALRRSGRADASRTDPAPSAESITRALLEPERLAGIDLSGARRIGALGHLLASACERMEAGGTVADVLWELWSGTSWPTRLRTAVDRGGGAARRAHRDLDAVCALFDAAGRAEEQRGHTGVRPFLDLLAAQEIPADSMAERGVRGESVRLLTAHRSKGLEWRLVVVAHVQEDSWPGGYRHSTLLSADEIGHRGPRPAVTVRESVAEDRRLFYVACTRARERLIVTAVASSDDEGEQPSRFLDEL